MPSKACSKCYKIKDLSDYVPSKKSRDGRQGLCRACNYAQVEKRRLENPGRLERIERNSHLKHSYGITIVHEDLMFADQGGACKICKKVDIKLMVDHSHATGNVRGLLCRGCNVLLGLTADSKDILQSAMDYLDQPKKTFVVMAKECA